MAVSKELVLELQSIVKEDYDKELNLQQASLIANTLVEYFDLLAKMYHQDKNDKQLKNEYEKREKCF